MSDRETSGSTTPRRSSAAVIRQACDACKTRKVKCISRHAAEARSGSLFSASSIGSCHRCSRLEIACTFAVPQKTRGPKRKHTTAVSRPRDIEANVTIISHAAHINAPSANEVYRAIHPENLSAQRLPPIFSALRQDHSSPHELPAYMNLHGSNTLSSTTQSPLTDSISENNVFTSTVAPAAAPPQAFATDVLCHRSLIILIMEDYMQLVYPLVPLVHLPSFQKDLNDLRDTYDNDFLGLIVSLCAITMANLPSKFAQYQRSNTIPMPFISISKFVDHAHKICVDLREPTYYDEVSHTKWAISYTFCIAFFQIGLHNRARMLEVESMQLARLLNLHQLSSMDGLDYIEVQLRKKAFCIMIYGLVHSKLQFARKERLTYLDSSVLQHIDVSSLLPLPLPDTSITATAILPAPSIGPTVNVTMGFNLHTKVFFAALVPLDPDSATSPTTTSGPKHCECVGVSAATQIRYLEERLEELTYMLDDAPAVLRQWAPSPSDHATVSTFGTTNETEAERKVKSAQMEAIRANLHVTHLWLQSMILDKINGLRDSDLSVERGDRRREWARREDICRQMLQVWHTFKEDDVEPNGYHLTCKIRDVAVSLLNCPFSPEEKPAIRANEYLHRFTEILCRLDGDELLDRLSLQTWIDTGRSGWLR